MWMTIAVMVVSFLLTKASGGSTKQALGVAAVAGAGTYLAVNNTDWGRDASNNFDDFLGLGDKPKGDLGSAGEGRTPVGKDADGKPIYADGPGNGSGGGSGSTGLLGSLGKLFGGLGGAGQAGLGLGIGVAAGSFIDKYGVWMLGAAGAYLIFKD